MLNPIRENINEERRLSKKLHWGGFCKLKENVVRGGEGIVTSIPGMWAMLLTSWRQYVHLKHQQHHIST
jgi:hypothetical protein